MIGKYWINRRGRFTSGGRHTPCYPKCDTNRAGHFTLDAHASRPVACIIYKYEMGSQLNRGAYLTDSQRGPFPHMGDDTRAA